MAFMLQHISGIDVMLSLGLHHIDTISNRYLQVDWNFLHRSSSSHFTLNNLVSRVLGHFQETIARYPTTNHID